MGKGGASCPLQNAHKIIVIQVSKYDLELERCRAHKQARNGGALGPSANKFHSFLVRLGYRLQLGDAVL